jgi:Tfp pilus assembly protein PilV
MRNLQLGTSLLEVLVALSLLSFSLFTLTHAQLLAMRTIKSAHWASCAHAELTTLAERLRSCHTESTLCHHTEIDTWQQCLPKNTQAKILLQDHILHATLYRPNETPIGLIIPL